MFTTLRSKLIFSSCAVALLCLLLAVVGTLYLAGDYVQKSGFKTLEQKRALAIPLLRISLTNRVPQTVGRAAVLSSIQEAIRASSLRVLLVDPSTSLVVEDTASKSAVGAKFDFKMDPTTLDARLSTASGVSGIIQLPGESDMSEYIAQHIRLLRQPGSGGGSSTDSGPIFQDIVVFAQPQVRLFNSIFGDLRGILLPAIIVALVISLVVAYFLARSISKPITNLAAAADAMARGDYNQRLPVEGRDELSTLTAQFNRMASEVAHARKMQRDFVGNVSHDLKTPLTSIQGFSQAILDGTIKDGRGYAQAAAIINNEAQRMSRLVSELLSLTRLENGLSSLELRPADISQVISQLVVAMQPQAQGCNVHLMVRLIGGQVTPVLADVDRLKQAFGNLIDNALKHTPEGGYVTVEVNAISEGVEVLVHDTGQGIPPEDLPRVMERFYQIDKARSSGSSRSLGLGLAIAREIVQAHRGTISIDSTVGVGTTVRIVLPSDARSPDPQPAAKKRLLRNTRQTTQPLSQTPNNEPQKEQISGIAPGGSNGARP